LWEGLQPRLQKTSLQHPIIAKTTGRHCRPVAFYFAGFDQSRGGGQIMWPELYLAVRTPDSVSTPSQLSSAEPTTLPAAS
jgi:hypothetical protein